MYLKSRECQSLIEKMRSKWKWATWRQCPRPCQWRWLPTRAPPRGSKLGWDEPSGSKFVLAWPKHVSNFGFKLKSKKINPSWTHFWGWLRPPQGSNLGSISARLALRLKNSPDYSKLKLSWSNSIYNDWWKWPIIHNQLCSNWDPTTVAISDLLCMKNAGAQIVMDFI